MYMTFVIVLPPQRVSIGQDTAIVFVEFWKLPQFIVSLSTRNARCERDLSDRQANGRTFLYQANQSWPNRAAVACSVLQLHFFCIE